MISMRKFLAAITLCIILIGTMSPITFSFSKNNSPTNQTGFSIQKAFAITCTSPQVPNAGGTQCVNPPTPITCTSPQVPNSAGTQCVDPPAPAPDAPGAGGGNTYACKHWYNLACHLTSFAVDLLTAVPTFIAVVVGVMADVFLKISIDPGTYGVSGSGSLIESGIRTAWTIVRDFSNIGFIFALFVAAFMLIVDKTSVGGTQFDPKKVVVRVIIMALLVNFSMLFCRITIQTADLFSNFLYSKIGDFDYTGSGTTVSAVGGLVGSTLKMKSVSLPIIALADPQKLFLNGGITPQMDGANAAYLIVGVITFAILFVLIFTFTSIMMIFLGRILGLWLGIILSPLAFVSFAIPFLEKDEFIGFDSWSKNFFQLAFMTPVYLFFMYITVSILNIKGIGSTVIPSQTITGSGSQGWMLNVLGIVLQTLIPLLLGCFMLLQGKKIATKMSGQIGQMVSGATGMVTGLAMGAATGGTAFLARQTAGRAATTVANSDTLNNLKTKGYGIGTAATFAGMGAGKLGAATFDVRDNKIFNKGVDKLGATMGEKINMGPDKFKNTGGFEAEGGLRDIKRNIRNTVEEKKAKWEEAKAASMVPSKGSKVERDKREKEDKLDRAKRAAEAETAKIAMEAENQNVNVVVKQLENDRAGMTARNPELDKDIKDRTKLKDDQKIFEDKQKALTTKIDELEVKEKAGTLTTTERTELTTSRTDKTTVEKDIKETKDKIKVISDKEDVKKFDKVDKEIKAFNSALAEEPNAAKRANMTVREVKQKQKNKEIVAKGSIEKQAMDEAKEKMDKEKESFDKLDTAMKGLEKSIKSMTSENNKLTTKGLPPRWSDEEIKDKEKEFASTRTKREEQYKKQKEAKDGFKKAEDVYNDKHGNDLKGLETATKSAEDSYKKDDDQKKRINNTREAVNLAQIDLNNTVDDITNMVYDNQKKLLTRLDANAKKTAPQIGQLNESFEVFNNAQNGWKGLVNNITQFGVKSVNDSTKAINYGLETTNMRFGRGNNRSVDSVRKIMKS